MVKKKTCIKKGDECIDKAIHDDKKENMMRQVVTKITQAARKLAFTLILLCPHPSQLLIL
jgi:hypothetical protein